MYTLITFSKHNKHYYMAGLEIEELKRIEIGLGRLCLQAYPLRSLRPRVRLY